MKLRTFLDIIVIILEIKNLFLCVQYNQFLTKIITITNLEIIFPFSPISNISKMFLESIKDY